MEVHAARAASLVDQDVGAAAADDTYRHAGRRVSPHDGPILLSQQVHANIVRLRAEERTVVKGLPPRLLLAVLLPEPNSHPISLQPFDEGVLLFVGSENVHVAGQEVVEVARLDHEVVTPLGER